VWSKHGACAFHAVQSPAPPSALASWERQWCKSPLFLLFLSLPISNLLSKQPPPFSSSPPGTGLSNQILPAEKSNPKWKKLEKARAAVHVHGNFKCTRVAVATAIAIRRGLPRCSYQHPGLWEHSRPR